MEPETCSLASSCGRYSSGGKNAATQRSGNRIVVLLGFSVAARTRLAFGLIQVQVTCHREAVNRKSTPANRGRSFESHACRIALGACGHRARTESQTCIGRRSSQRANVEKTCGGTLQPLHRARQHFENIRQRVGKIHANNLLKNKRSTHFQGNKQTRSFHATYKHIKNK